MKTLLIASALALSVSPALATDWTGFYAGVHGGYAKGDQSGTPTYTDESGVYAFTGGSYKFDGGLVGGQIGYQHQFNQLVLGVEGDFSGADLSGGGVFDLPGGYRWEIDTSVDKLATLRGRVGFAMGPVLIFATGGAAWVDTSLTEHVLVTTGEQGMPAGTTTVRATSNDQRWGWVAGAGAELALGDNWSLKGEWHHINVGDSDNKFTGTAYPGLENETANYTNDSFPGSVKFDVIRFGANYRF